MKIFLVLLAFVVFLFWCMFRAGKMEDEYVDELMKNHEKKE